MKRISSVAVALLVLSLAPVQAGEGPQEFRFGAERVLTTGSGTFHVSGDPGEFVVLQLEKIDEKGVLWGARYVDGKPGSTEPIAAGVDLDAPVYLDSRPGSVVVGWRSGGIWQVTVGESGAGATSLSLSAGEELLDIAARGDDWNRVIAVLRSGLIVELDLASGKSTPLYTLPGAPLAASIASDAVGVALAWLDRESEDLFFVSLDEQGRAGVARKLNTAPAAAISGAIGLRDGAAVVGWVERWADEDVAIVSRVGRGGRASIEETIPLSTIGKRVTRVELASSGERMAVWDEKGERLTVSLVSLGEDGDVHCFAELDQPAAQQREWLIGGGDEALLFTERSLEDGTTTLSVRELHCDGRGDGGKAAASRGEAALLDEVEEFPVSDSRILGGVDDPCDGYDNDSDGIVDEGCDLVCDEPDAADTSTHVSQSTDSASQPSLAWTGNEYGIAWTDYRDGNGEIYFARLDRAGAKIGSEVRVTLAADTSMAPSLVWTGSEYGLVWCDYRNGDGELYFARLGSTGSKIGGDQRLTWTATEPELTSLVWTGSEYGVAWVEGNPATTWIRFARLDSFGAMIGSEFTLSDASPSSATHPSVVWTGTEYGVAWHDDRALFINEVYFARVSSSGAKIGSDVRVSDLGSASSYRPSLAWNGTEYGVVWVDLRGTEDHIYFSTISSGGTPGTDIRVMNPAYDCDDPSLVWTGAEYGLAWMGWASSGQGLANFAAMDSGGYLTGPGYGIPLGAEQSLWPALIWAGGDYGVAWTFNDTATADPSEVHFATIRCCDDLDSDGYSECEDPNDGDPASNPDIDETCDGRDNDGNGLVDDGCDGVCDAPRSDGEQRITNDSATSSDASLVSTGGNFGVAWEENRDGQLEIYFARTDSSGSKIGSDLRVTSSAGDSEEVSVAWSGSEYGLAWHDDRDGNTEIYFARVDAAGNKIGSDVRITDDGALSEYPSLVWNGSEYGVAWEDRRDGNREIYFARIDAAGNRIGAITRVTDHAGESYRPSLGWSGSEYGLAWHDYRDGNYEIYFTRLDALGLEIGDDYRVTDDAASSYDPSLVWSDIRWGVAWSDDRFGNYEIYAALIDTSGVQIGVDRRVTSDSGSSSSCSLAWTGSEYAVSFQDNRDGTYEIFLARLDSSVGKIGTESQLTSFGTSRHRPSLVWTGERHAMAWYDNRDGNAEIYLGFVDCCDDADSDGFTECDGDSNDADPDAHPGATETCDGEDDNGDGNVDEGCDSICDAPLPQLEIAVTSTSENSAYPEMCWDGGGYGVIWSEGPFQNHVYFARLDAAGRQVGTETQVSAGTAQSITQEVVWTGSEYAALWYDNRDLTSQLWFARIDSDGNLIGSEQRITSSPNGVDAADLVWTGSEYGVVWTDYRHSTDELYFVRLDASGNRIGSSIRVTDSLYDAILPALVWNGSGYGLVWEGAVGANDELFYVRLDERGVPIDSEVQLTNGTDNSDRPSLVWAGTLYGVAWSDGATVQFAQFDEFGTKSGSDVTVATGSTYAGRARLVWTGEEYAISWQDNRNGPFDLFLARLDEYGEKVGDDVSVVSSPAMPFSLAIAWTGHELALVWSDDRGADLQIYFKTTRCCDDVDSDGYTECDGDPNDADPASNPGVAEACDGSDNDGDAEIDEGCDSICDAPEENAADSRVTTDAGVSSNPAMVWADGEYGVAWADNRASGFDVFFSRVDASGTKVGAAVQLSAGSGNSSAADLAWTGNVYGAAWQDNRDGNEEIYFALVDQFGVQIGADIRVTRDAGASHAPKLAWNGSDFAVIWEDDRDGNWELYFARLDTNGLKIGGDMRLTQDSASSLELDFVWTGTEYGIAWRDNRDGNNEIYFVRLNSHGVPIGAPTRVTNDAAYSAGVSIAWTGTEYGLAWNDARDVEWALWFARIDVSGTKIGGDVRLTADDAFHAWYPSLVWTGSEYGVSWRDDRDGNDEIYFARLTGTGTKLTPEIRLTDDTGGSILPVLAWNGERHAVAWQDDRDGNTEIYFTQVRCCDDADSDGYTECAGDTDDQDAGVNPDRIESCDGRDNDADGLVDEDCDGTCDAPENDTIIAVTNTPDDNASDPRLVSTADGYAVVWYEFENSTHQVFFALLDRHGQVVGEEVRVSQEGVSAIDPSLVWTGSEYGIAYLAGPASNRCLTLTRLDAYGARIGADHLLDSNGYNTFRPVLVWNGSGYAVAWHENRDGNGEIYFARTDPNGNRIGNVIRMSEDSEDSDNPTLAWNGDGYGLAWDDGSGGGRIHFCQLGVAGNRIGDESLLVDYAEASAWGPALVWTGQEYGAFWFESRGVAPWSGVFGARLTASGTWLMDLTRFSELNGMGLSATWTGAEYGIAYKNVTPSWETSYYLIRLDADGINSASDQLLETGASVPSGGALAWDGERYLFTWAAYADYWRDVFLTFIECCDDTDQDGYTECAGDPNDADPAIHPDAPETCDGRDDDGDGAVDEGCDGDCDDPEESGADLRLTTDSAISILPAAAWNGGGYGVAWEDSRDGSRDVYFAALDPAGGRLGADLAITSDPGNAEDPALVWTGDGYGVAWKDDRDGNEEIYFARLDPSGTKTSGDMRISYDPGASHQPSVAWNGSEFGVVWEDDRSGDWDLYFARVDAAGNRIGGEVRVMAGSFGSLEPQLVWTGTQYGMVWRDIRDGNWEVYFTRLDTHGTLLGADIRITNDSGYSSGLALVWTGSEFAVAWNDARDTEWEIWFARIDHLGAKIGGDVRITDDDAFHSWFPSLTWTGSEYGVAWRDERDGNNEIYFTRLSDAGTKLLPDMRLTDDVGGSFTPALTWNGDRHGVTWHDDRDGNGEIYFTQVRCCDDADSDGYSECAGDADDQDAGINPDRTETCDGRDNDADGITDEGCDGSCDSPETVSSAVRLSHVDAFAAGHSEIVWNGSGYGAFWQDERQGGPAIYFSPLDASGQLIGGEVRVSPVEVGDSSAVSIAWSGREYGVVWRRLYDVLFARLDTSGNVIGSTIEVTPEPNGPISAVSSPKIVWAGGEWAVAWTHYSLAGNETLLARFDASGNKIGGDVRIDTLGETADSPSLAWTGSGYGIAWVGPGSLDQAEIYLSRLDSTGATLASMAVSADDGVSSSEPVLHWNGSGYGLAWEDRRDANREIYFRLLHADGTPNGGETRVTADDGFPSKLPDLVWTGSGYGVTWYDQRSGDYQIFFAGLDDLGASIGSAFQVTPDAAHQTSPAIAWTGERFALSWTKSVAVGENEIHAVTLRCCDDADSDGWSECAGDTNDGDSDAWPGHRENCDGGDDDGDGLIDEVCDRSCDAPEKNGIEQRISELSAISKSPDVTWTGDRYGVVWGDDRDGNEEIYYAAVDAWGNRIGTDRRVTYQSERSADPALVWHGAGYGLAWRDTRDGNSEIYFVKLTADGANIGGGSRITQDAAQSYGPDLVWTGSEYGLVWQDDRDGAWAIWFARIDAAGNKIGADIRVSDTGGNSWNPDVVWTGTEYGVSWREERDGNWEIYFARLDRYGQRIGGELRVTNDAASSRIPSIVWNGAEYGIAWYDNRDGNNEIYFARVDSAGLKIGSDVRVTSSSGHALVPRLAWTGQEYGLVWYDNRHGNYEIFFARIATGGGMFGAEMRLTTDSALSDYPALAWSGAGFVTVWQDARDGNTEIYAAAVRCCEDRDFDGYTVCEGDTNDADPDTYPGADELCDGADNNADGAVDEVCDGSCDTASVWGIDHQLTTDPAQSYGAALAWSGGEYGLAWTDVRDGNNEIWFGRIDRDGDRIGDEIRITADAANSNGGALAWNGSEYGLAWRDTRDGNGEVYFTRVGPTGAKLGGDLRLTENPSDVTGLDMIWAGDRYAVGWSDSRDGNWEVYLALFDAQGNRIGGETRITEWANESWGVKLAWSGSEYGMVWRDHMPNKWGIYFARADAAGNKIGEPVALTIATYDSYHPSIVWNGSEYGVVWQDKRHNNNEIYFARIGADGVKIGSDVRITDNGGSSASPRVAWTGEEYGVTWYDNYQGNFEVYFVRLDATGNPVGSEVRLSNASGMSEWPNLVWTGEHFGVAWPDARGADYEVFFNTVKCCGNDQDADAWGSCDDCDDLNDAANPGETEVCDFIDNNCDDVIDEGFPVPGAVAGLVLNPDKQLLSWNGATGADRYDITKGDLGLLRASGGNFATAVTGCLENDGTNSSELDPATPSPGAGFFYLVRAQYVCKDGSYDTGGAGQAGSRDEEVSAAGAACP